MCVRDVLSGQEGGDSDPDPDPEKEEDGGALVAAARVAKVAWAVVRWCRSVVRACGTAPGFSSRSRCCVVCVRAAQEASRRRSQGRRPSWVGGGDCVERRARHLGFVGCGFSLKRRWVVGSWA